MDIEITLYLRKIDWLVSGESILEWETQPPTLNVEVYGVTFKHSGVVFPLPNTHLHVFFVHFI